MFLLSNRTNYFLKVHIIQVIYVLQLYVPENP